VSIFEAIIVASVTVAAVVALVLLVWTIGLRGRHEVYIAPFHIAGGQPDPALGVALANMLRARLERLQRELSSMHQVLKEQPPPRDAATNLGAIVLPTSIEVPQAVFEPVNIEVSIGKVSVGGLLSWLQQRALAGRTVQLTVFFEPNRAIVSGSLEPLGVTKVRDLWVETEGTASEIVTKTAHALLQSRIAEAGEGPIEALVPNEFEDLLWCLHRLAELNRRGLSGGSREESVASAGEALERLTPLAQRFPEWQALVQLALSVAERAGRTQEAQLFRIQLGLAPAIAVEAEDVADEPDASEKREEFVNRMSAFFQRVLPDHQPPTVVFGQSMHSGLQAFWNADLDRYEVNPDAADIPGLDAYVALMGRFMELHYSSCIAERENGLDPNFWNEFRMSVVEYLMQTDPEVAAEVDQSAAHLPLYEQLLELDAQQGVSRGGLRHLMLGLLEHFDCDWSPENLAKRIIEVNGKVGSPVPESTLRAVLERAPQANEAG
jgi:hypothetical protein